MDQVITYYEKMMLHYLRNPGEQQLYAGQQLSKILIEKDISPEDILGLHLSTMKHSGYHLPEEWERSFQFLIEIMVSFGMAYQERQSLRLRRKQLESEITVAASMQQNLYPRDVPDGFHDLDIGFISTPAREMSGDFYYFTRHVENKLGILVADIMGKGIPAALCMSMIKYGMDTLENEAKPATMMLAYLNRLVLKNADPSLFVTMFYTIYDPLTSVLTYASAGHEPALYWQASSGTYLDLNTRGLLLGVDPNVIFEEKSLSLASGDFVLLYTDGVTECKGSDAPDDNSLLREALANVDVSLSAHDIVQHLYQYIITRKAYQLDDDHTIVLIRKR